MKLRMLQSPGGTHDGQPWPEVGGIVEITHPVVIADLVRNHIAEVVPEKPEKKPEALIETAEKAPPENTAKRTAKPAPRKGTK